MWLHRWHFWLRIYLLLSLKTGLWSLQSEGIFNILMRGNPALNYDTEAAKTFVTNLA